ncbi:MAG: Gfo/Idh/MocA family oxidoreductase [Phaeodactylibacter sp.]|nr:Gfo/Idh/MocA family oxidoreductase [Phaeodactylibacter sp.]MCB9275961.1 Gfo/Idh/MocA family oxidoreductase [Lewinellaceae bacterium]
MKKALLLFITLAFSTFTASGQEPSGPGGPVRLGVVGLVHDHVHWILGRPDQGDIQLVGIVEPNRELAARYAKQYGFSMEMAYPTIEAMLDATRPEAVAAFNSIYGHLEVVEKCAPRGIHVMVEKPLAVSMAHAKRMAALARQHHIHLLTNYETTWYGSNHQAYQMIRDGKVGALRKVVVHDGHRGPKEIGVSKEFLDWLTDPVLNGGGALTDFGCYGANLATWLMQGERPLSVTCVTQQHKPDIYPRVDDEATIVLTYPGMQGIIQASWNWPYNRKDMECYGQTGYVITQGRTNLSVLLDEAEGPFNETAPEPQYEDPFAFLAAVVRGREKPSPLSLSSLENNLIVVEILEAARKSAKKGRTIKLKPK